jgi:hypothetical protein
MSATRCAPRCWNAPGALYPAGRLPDVDAGLRRQPGRAHPVDVVPAAIAACPGDPARPPARQPPGPPEDATARAAAYAEHGVRAEVAPFFDDMPAG